MCRYERSFGRLTGEKRELMGRALEGMHERERRNRKWAKFGVSKVLARIIQGGHAHARWVPRTLHACRDAWISLDARYLQLAGVRKERGCRARALLSDQAPPDSQLSS